MKLTCLVQQHFYQHVTSNDTFLLDCLRSHTRIQIIRTFSWYCVFQLRSAIFRPRTIIAKNPDQLFLMNTSEYSLPSEDRNRTDQFFEMVYCNETSTMNKLKGNGVSYTKKNYNFCNSRAYNTQNIGFVRLISCKHNSLSNAAATNSVIQIFIPQNSLV